MSRHRNIHRNRLFYPQVYPKRSVTHGLRLGPQKMIFTVINYITVLHAKLEIALHRYCLVRTTIVRLKRNGIMHYVHVYSEFSAHKRCFVCCVISLFDNTLDIFCFLVKCFLCGLLLTAGSTFYLKSSVCNVGLVSFLTSALSQYLYIR